MGQETICGEYKEDSEKALTKLKSFIAKLDPSEQQSEQKSEQHSEKVVGGGESENEILKKKKGGRYLVLQIDPEYNPPATETRTVYGDEAALHGDISEVRCLGGEWIKRKELSLNVEGELVQLQWSCLTVGAETEEMPTRMYLHLPWLWQQCFGAA